MLLNSLVKLRAIYNTRKMQERCLLNLNEKHIGQLIEGSVLDLKMDLITTGVILGSQNIDHDFLFSDDAPVGKNNTVIPLDSKSTTRLEARGLGKFLLYDNQFYFRSY